MDLPFNALPKLKPEYKTRWLEALRSGDYRQTQQTLRNDEGFCCLGVLCDVVKNDVNTDWTNERGGYTFLGADTELPDDVTGLVFSERQPTDVDPLAGYNDGHWRGAAVTAGTFSEIADIIEKWM